MHFIYNNDLQAQNFLTMNFFRFANDMTKTTIINLFNSDNSNIVHVKIHYHQIMMTVTDRILKFETMTKKSIVTDNTFFTVITFSRLNSFTLINSIKIKHL